MAFLSAALILGAVVLAGGAASSAKAVPIPIASENSTAATTDDFIITFSFHFLLRKRVAGRRYIALLIQATFVHRSLLAPAMAGHSRSKNGVAYCPGHPRL